MIECILHNHPNPVRKLCGVLEARIFCFGREFLSFFGEFFFFNFLEIIL